MAQYKLAAMICKTTGEIEQFKAYRNSWCTLEALLPVNESEYAEWGLGDGAEPLPGASQ